MANTLTNLIPTLYEALDIVARELTGLIPAVRRNSSIERAAVDETVRFPVVPAMSAAAITPAATGPDPSAQTIGSDTMTISSSRSVTFYWEGEEQKGLRNAETYGDILRDQFAQAMRTLANEVEVDLAELYVAASRAYGTAGTTPFASSLADTAQLKKILDDNGAPASDRQMVINTTAGAAMRTLTQLTKANEAGGDDMLRRGVLMDIHGFALRESAQIQDHTKGTGTSYLFSQAEAIGQTTLSLDGGSGTMLAGDVITHASDSVNKYIVTTALSGGDVVIGKPGLRIAGVNDEAVSIGDGYAANMAFHRNAIQLVTRAPAMPEGGDAADDVMEIQDPVSGLGFQVAVYRQRRRVAYEVGLAWGQKCVKAEFLALLLG